jgi:excisionase family DNA binding protein
VTLRTLYRFIDEGQLPAYKMGRVIRLQARDVDDFIARARIVPGTLEHLYPDPRGVQAGRGQHHDDDQHHEDEMAASDRSGGGPVGAEAMDLGDVKDDATQ